MILSKKLTEVEAAFSAKCTRRKKKKKEEEEEEEEQEEEEAEEEEDQGDTTKTPTNRVQGVTAKDARESGGGERGRHRS